MTTLLLITRLAVLLLLCSSTGMANAHNDAAAQFTIVGDRIVGGVRMGQHSTIPVELADRPRQQHPDADIRYLA